jgi:hypothetical protein
MHQRPAPAPPQHRAHARGGEIRESLDQPLDIPARRAADQMQMRGQQGERVQLEFPRPAQVGQRIEQDARAGFVGEQVLPPAIGSEKLCSDRFMFSPFEKDGVLLSPRESLIAFEGRGA